MVAKVHKNTYVRRILIVFDVIFCMLAKHIIGNFSRFPEGGLDFFDLKNTSKSSQIMCFAFLKN